MKCGLGFIFRSLILIFIAVPLFASDADKLLAHLDSQRANERAAALNELFYVKDVLVAKKAINRMHQYNNWTTLEVSAVSNLLSLQEITVSVEALNESIEGLRRAAILDLSKRSPELLTPIIKELITGDEERNNLAIAIIEKVISQHGTTPAHAALALILFNSDKDARRVSAVNALMYMPSVDKVIINQISQDQSAQVRSALVIVVIKNLLKAERDKLSDESAWLHDKLHALAQDPDDLVRFTVCDKIVGAWTSFYQSTQGQRYVDFSLAALSDKSYRVRERILRVFTYRPNAQAIPIIEKLVDDPEGVIADQALYVLEHLKLPSLCDHAFRACSLPHPQTKQHALRLLEEGNDPRLIPVANRLLNDPDSSVRSAAQEVLAKANISNNSGIFTFAKVTKMQTKELQSVLVRMAQLESKERNVEINKMYNQMSPEQRIDFMEFCARVPRMAYDANEFLVQRAQDSDPAIAIFAFRTLQRINDRGGMFGVAVAMERIDDKEKEVAHQAMILLHVTAKKAWPSAFSRFAKNEYEIFKEGNSQNNIETPTSKEDFSQLSEKIKEASIEDKKRYFSSLASIDEPQARKILQEFARSSERLVRWAALDALVLCGDQSDATLDHGIARLLTVTSDRWNSMGWPVIDQKLLTRLATFHKIYDTEKIAKLQAEIERRIAIIQNLEVVR